MKAETLQPVETKEPAGDAREAGERVPAVIQIKNILVPLDFSEMSLKSVRYAVPFARQFGATLTLVHVIEAPLHEDAAASSYSRDQLEGLENRLGEMIPPDISVSTTVRQNVPFDGILEVAEEIEADLIITTTHGYTGLMRLITHGTVDKIVHRSPCPVLVVREHGHDFV